MVKNSCDKDVDTNFQDLHPFSLPGWFVGAQFLESYHYKMDFMGWNNKTSILNL